MVTEIKLPTEPKSFAVDLPLGRLRQLDFTALDYNTARQSIIEYIKTYYPNDFNDFVASNGMMILIDIISAVTDKLSLRSDLLAGEAFLPTAVTEEAVENHLQLIGERILRQTAATVEIEVSVDSPVFVDTIVPAGMIVSSVGADGNEVFFEVYKGPGDWTNDIVIPAGKRGVIAWGIQGKFASEYSNISIGGSNQSYSIPDDNILSDPMFVDVTYGGIKKRWRTIFEPIQKYSSKDEVVEVQFFTTTLEGQPIVKLVFGDDINGKAPITGSIITVNYRIGGGVKGRIAAGVIDQSKNIRSNSQVVSINFRNISPSSGGTDKETIEEAKKRAPKTFALHNSISSATDYITFTNNFVHPYYGKIGKSAIILETSPNQNIVDVYVLAEGNDGLPTTATTHLKEALKSAITSINVVTDEVRIKDGIIKPIDLNLIVVLDRNADARIVKNKVLQEITVFFSIGNFDLGEPLYISNLIEVIEAIDGVRYIDLRFPTNNILALNSLANGDQNFVGVNEIITLGNSQVDFYYDNISQSNYVI